jgi:ketosteroid isomerase-like protein
MNTRDPKLTALQFNEYINDQDVEGLASLMTEDHTFIDRKGKVDEGKETMTKGWIEFFETFPEYRNTFSRVESRDDLVILLGYATWHKGDALDHAIWTARIRDDLVAEWRIYPDTEESRSAIELRPYSVSSDSYV